MKIFETSYKIGTFGEWNIWKQKKMEDQKVKTQSYEK